MISATKTRRVEAARLEECSGLARSNTLPMGLRRSPTIDWILKNSFSQPQSCGIDEKDELR